MSESMPAGPVTPQRPEIPPEAPAPRRFRPDIQGLRAIAVLAVVLYHADVPYLTGGYVGVDVFFVISGFLITSQLVREVGTQGRVHFGQFYASRVRRLLPAAGLVITLTVIAARLVDSILDVRSVAVDALWSSVYLLNYRLAAEGVDYQHASDAVSPLQHLWSLAVEEQFYILWPLLLMVCVWLGRRRLRATLVAVAGLVFLVSFGMSVLITPTNPPYAYFSLHTRAWELAAGALLAVAVPLLRPTTNARLLVAMSWAGIAVILIASFVFTDDTPFPGTAAVLPVAGTVLVIGGGTFYQRFGAERLLDLQPMQQMGKVSYSWYLWHWPLVVLAPMVLDRNLGWKPKLAVMVVAYVLALLTHRFLEAPARRSRLPTAWWLPIGAAISGGTALVAVLVLLTMPSLVGRGADTTATPATSVSALQRQLTSALSVREVPANLTPAVSAASDDEPSSTANGCHADYLDVAQGACVYGDPQGSRTLVLFGDSHLQQWLPAFDAEGKALGWKVVAWTKAACPVADLPAYVNPKLRGPYTQCPQWRAKTVERIVALKPEVVVMGQSDQIDPSVSARSWADSTARSVRSLEQRGLNVRFLLDTPRPPSSNPECVADHLADVRSCAFSVADAYGVAGSDYRIRPGLVRSTLTNEGVSIFDPRPLLCSTAEARCPAIVANLLVYRDNSHMSTAYSSFLAPLTEPLFSSATRG